MAFELYFLRHGEAVEKEDWAGDDESRPLTSEGAKRIKREAEALAALGLKPEEILASPLVRAFQTAEILARGLGISSRLIREERLAPGFGLSEMKRILEARRSATKLMLVGHEPDFSATIGAMIGGGRVECRKGSLVRLDLRDPASTDATLAWLIPAKILG